MLRYALLNKRWDLHSVSELQKLELREKSSLSWHVYMQKGWQQCWNGHVSISALFKGPVTLCAKLNWFWNSILLFIPSVQFWLWVVICSKKSQNYPFILKHKVLKSVAVLCICNIFHLISSWNSVDWIQAFLSFI